MVLCNESQLHIQSLSELVTGSTEESDNHEKKMTYNEWRQMRKRRKLQNKAPEFQTRLQSLEVQAGYSVKLSVVISALPAPRVIWTVDDEEICNDHIYTIEQDEDENKYSLTISQISVAQSGCYQCTAVNSEGSDNSIGFLNVKDSSTQKRRRSVSRRPLVSTIMESKSREEPEPDPVKERLLLLNRHCWDWWNLGSLMEEEDNKESRAKREQSCDLDLRESDSKTEEEWEESRRRSQMNSTRSKSLPNMTEGIVENRYAKLKAFWERQKFPNIK